MSTITLELILICEDCEKTIFEHTGSGDDIYIYEVEVAKMIRIWDEYDGILCGDCMEDKKRKREEEGQDEFINNQYKQAKGVK